jgi:ubiquinone/menaquinone biosynthesis C-methylase UbiE
MAEQSPYVFDGIAKVYDATRSLPEDVMKAAVDALSEELAGHESVLDVGVGTGRFALPLASRGVKVVGLDLAREMMLRAREKGFADAVMGSATSMPFRDKAFDAAVMVHLLHLVPDWRAVLGEVRRCVRCTLLTVGTERPKNNEAREMYERRLAELGYGPAFAGLHERELAKMLKPDIAREVAEFDEVLPYDMLIGQIERREYSWANRLPDDLHAKVVGEVRQSLGNGVDSIRQRIFVYGWKVGRLAEVNGRPQPRV